MIKALSIVLIFLSAQSAYCQDEKDKKIHFKYSIRGKAIGWVVSPEDDFAMTATIGNEFLFNRHSIGVDFTYFRFRHQTDDEVDLPLFDLFERKRYLLFDYKFRFAKFDWGGLYFNAYERIGLYDDWYEGLNIDSIGYDPSFLQSTTEGTFHEPGFGMGAKFYWGGFGIDISANYGHRFSRNNYVNAMSETVTEIENNVERDRNVFYMRLNLFYEFRRGK